MGWETSDRRAELPSNWPKLRKGALIRDKYRCRWILKSGRRCSRAATDVDHIVPGGPDKLSNLRSLCADHHAKKSSIEGNRAREGRRKSRWRPKDPHPGDLR